MSSSVMPLSTAVTVTLQPAWSLGRCNLLSVDLFTCDDDENTENAVLVKVSGNGALPRMHLFDSRIFCCVLASVHPDQDWDSGRRIPTCSTEQMLRGLP